jgi:hypothetical protein
MSLKMQKKRLTYLQQPNLYLEPKMATVQIWPNRTPQTHCGIDKQNINTNVTKCLAQNVAILFPRPAACSHARLIESRRLVARFESLRHPRALQSLAAMKTDIANKTEHTLPTLFAASY